jgi:hypothetical protein
VSVKALTVVCKVGVMQEGCCNQFPIGLGGFFSEFKKVLGWSACTSPAQMLMEGLVTHRFTA